MQHEILISIPFLAFTTMDSSFVDVAPQRVYEHEKDQVEHYFDSMNTNRLSAKSLISDARESMVNDRVSVTSLWLISSRPL